MTTDQWALLVSIGAATVATLNMLISALVYRRARPRVRVSVGWGLVGVDFVSDVVALADTGRPGFQVHVRNLSPTAAKVGEVAVLSKHVAKKAPPRMIPWIRRKSPHVIVQHRANFAKNNKTTEKPEMELAAFGGLRWEIEPNYNYAVHQWGSVSQWDALSVQVTLTNSDRMRSPWLSREYIASTEEGLHRIFSDSAD